MQRAKSANSGAPDPAPASGDSPLVRLCGIGKHYPASEGSGERRTILHDVNLDLRAGEFVALLGKSGSGKSTLLNLISGIDDPSAGTVWVGAVPLTQLPERDRTLFRRQHIGFVFQFFNLIPTLTVAENVRLPLELNDWPAARAAARTQELLTRIGLADRARAFPDRLSGGEQQRIAIARALAANPALILADEPTGNLDEETGRVILSLLLELTRQAGRTLIMATHSLEIAGQADRILRIAHGQPVELPNTGRANGQPIPQRWQEAAGVL